MVSPRLHGALLGKEHQGAVVMDSALAAIQPAVSQVPLPGRWQLDRVSMIVDQYPFAGTGLNSREGRPAYNAVHRMSYSAQTTACQPVLTRSS